MPPIVAASSRDHRVDFLRGAALLTIFVNHIPGNAFEAFTHRNFGFSDAAEIFVLLAGFAACFAYDRSFSAGDRLTATLKAWGRAGLLYLCHAATTLAAIALFCAASIHFVRPGYLTDSVPGLYINIATVFTDTPRAFIGLATGGHQLGYFNILPMYAVLLLMLPAIMLLARAGASVLLAASVSLWIAAGLFAIDPPNYPLGGGWYFNPIAWQLVFVIGFCLALAQRRGMTMPFSRLAYGASIAYLVFCCLIVKFDLWHWITGLPVPDRLWDFDKTYVSAPRLLHVLALGYVLVAGPVGALLARAAAGNPLRVLGRNSLPVFCWGSLLSMVAFILRTEFQGGVLMDAALVTAGAAVLYGIASVCDRKRHAAPEQRTPAPLNAALTAPALP